MILRQLVDAIPEERATLCCGCGIKPVKQQYAIGILELFNYGFCSVSCRDLALKVRRKVLPQVPVREAYLHPVRRATALPAAEPEGNKV